MAYDDLLINGTSITVASARVVEAWDPLMAVASVEGENISLPNRPGALWTAKQKGPRPFTLALHLLDAESTGIPSTSYDTRLGRVRTNWRTLCRLLESPRSALTLTRKVALSTGNEDHTCRAEWLGGTEPVFIDGRDSPWSATIDLVNLDGVWWRSTTDTINSAGASWSSTVLGDTDTRKMTITFAGVASGAQVLTNTTTGVSVTYTGTTTTNSAVLDCDAFTATRTGTGNVIGNVTHSGDDDWMVLAPGSNSFTLTGGGTCSIVYYPAFL